MIQVNFHEPQDYPTWSEEGLGALSNLFPTEEIASDMVDLIQTIREEVKASPDKASDILEEAWIWMVQESEAIRFRGGETL